PESLPARKSYRSAPAFPLEWSASAQAGFHNPRVDTGSHRSVRSRGTAAQRGQARVRELRLAEYATDRAFVRVFRLERARRAAQMAPAPPDRSSVRGRRLRKPAFQ